MIARKAIAQRLQTNARSLALRFQLTHRLGRETATLGLEAILEML
jgi:Tfp pilus assembly protein PilF